MCQAKRNIRCFFASKLLLSSFGLIGPVIYLYLEKSGLNAEKIYQLQAFFCAIIVLLEVPSGYIADCIGRKRILVIAAICEMLAQLCYGLASSFVGFMFAEALCAIAFSFISGADEALLVDSLIEADTDVDVKQMLGPLLAKFSFWTGFSAGGFCLLGGLIGQYSLRMPFLVGAVFGVLLVIASLSYKEPKINAESRPKRAFRPVEVFALVHDLLNNRQTAWLMLASALHLALLCAAFWAYQPYFSTEKLPVWSLGLIFASLQVIYAFGSRMALCMEARVGVFRSYLVCMGLIAIGCLLMAGIVGPYSFCLIYFGQVSRGIWPILVSGRFNALLASDLRATALSLNSMGGRMCTALIYLLVGPVLLKSGVCAAFFLIGSLAALVTLVGFLGMRRSRMQVVETS